ncbi:MAG: hypothetical protein GX895_03220 [Clostridiales bacterium]|uniref:hypothetical protein n=1 Tax=Clostridium sp. N3C TaxID=1776758 RepID=UPI00092E027A|nr:hypothetical protein [Clostridium sp. N3C]NLZ47792.1 hypothetical protein [Clostridiales bacterium]SCN24912.1 hypothetical protein N3C_2054 [Clostridium sp. N3C]
MKNTFLSLILICIGITFNNYTVKANTSNELLKEIQVNTIEYNQNQIFIIRSITTLKRGEVGLITIKGKPGERYTIESSFSVKGKIIPVKQWRIADSNGMASFSWVVGRDTDIGTYNATIHGGGATLNITHNVTS